LVVFDAANLVWVRGLVCILLALLSFFVAFYALSQKGVTTRSQSFDFSSKWRATCLDATALF
jgi:hypothetical protein